MLELDGLGSILPEFDAFALDQWGVLHDGRSTYPGVLQILQAIRDQGKEVIIVTNSSKSADRNVNRLRDSFDVRVGSHFSQLVSSAQLLRDSIASGPPTKVHVISAPEDSELLDDCPHVTETPIAEADLVLLLSTPSGNRETIVETIVQRRVPVWVPSADIDSVTPSGLVAGLRNWVVDLRSRNVEVRNFGKPERAFYESCDRYWESGRPARVLAVGDQLLTDVVGAQHVGWSTALVKTGAGDTRTGLTSGVAPDFLVPEFRL